MVLSGRDRTEILMIPGYGGKIRNQVEVYALVSAKYRKNYISQSTFGKMIHKFEETGSVNDFSKNGRSYSSLS